MSFLRRLFSSDYRRAVALEGAGRYREAAEHYHLAGERESAARMHRRLARDAQDPWERVDALRKALDLAPEGEPQAEELRAALREELAEALVALVEHAGVMDRRDRAWLQEAADLFSALGRHERAGEVLAKLGFHSRAADAFEAAGNIQRMEEMFRRGESQEAGKSAFEQAWDAFEFAQNVGDLLGAVEALGRCVDLRPNDAGLYGRLEELRRRMPRSGRITLRCDQGAWTLIGGESVTIGREEENPLLLLESGVSRVHARLSLGGRGVTLEDMGSTHGTFVGGAQLRQPLALSDTGELRVGRSATLRFTFQPGGALPARFVVQGGALKGQRFVWANAVLTTGIPPDEPEWMPPGLALEFRRGYWHLVPDPDLAAVKLGGRPCTTPTLLQLGDELEIDGQHLRVE